MITPPCPSGHISVTVTCRGSKAVPDPFSDTAGRSCLLISPMTCSSQTRCRPCGGFLFWRNIAFSRGLVETPIQLLSVRPVLHRQGECFAETSGGLPRLASESLSHCSGLKIPSPHYFHDSVIIKETTTCS